MLPRRTWIWQRNSQPTASGKPGAVQSSAPARGCLIENCLTIMLSSWIFAHSVFNPFFTAA